MPSRQLTVNGQPFYINTDKKAGVNSLTVNGSTTYIDRTAPVIDADRKGESRPLLSKLVGDAASAYSLRDLNDKQGNNKVVHVRRATDNDDKDFVAKDVDKIADWVSGKLDTTLPCDVATAASAYSLRKVNSSHGEEKVLFSGLDELPWDDANSLIYTDSISSENKVSFGSNGLSFRRLSTTGSGLTHSITYSNGILRLESTATSPRNDFSNYLRITDLPANKRFTLTGQVRVAVSNLTGNGTVGNAPARIDFNDSHQQVAKFENTEFQPFSVTQGWNQTLENSSTVYNFFDLTLYGDGADDSSLQGTVAVEFKDLKIIENPNYVVRVRRGDNIEADVKFDAFDKVSLDSEIVNATEDNNAGTADTDQGGTSTRTLRDFLSESNFSDVAVNSFDSSSRNANDNLYVEEFTPHTNGFTVEAKFTGGITASDTVRVHNALPTLISEVDAAKTKFKVTFTIDEISGQGSDTGAGNLYVKASNNILNGGGTYPLQNTPNRTTSGDDASFTFNSTGNHTIEGYQYSNGNTPFGGFSFIIYRGTRVKVSNIKYEVSHGATVNTWYNQASFEDDAIQQDATKQPTIAEHGALLADGISFDGTNDFLDTDGVFTDNRSASIFTKVKALASDATGTDWFYTEGYSGENSSVAQTIGVGITDSGNIADISASTDINSNDARASVLANGGVISLIGGTSTTTSHANGVQMGSITTPTNASGNYTVTTSGGIGGHSSTSSLAKFSIDELILYTSDQSANRHKIENNINNYYGLYNDANEVTGAFTSSGAEDFTPNGTDGFRLETDEDSSYGGIQLKEKVASGTSIYVSFNLDVNLEGTASPTLGLRQSTVDGALAVSGVTTLSQGFNSITLTSNNSNAEFITFGEGHDDNTYKVSDFKVSRIARNGFVDIWYDQSGLGHDLTQIDDTLQPHIVENGSYLGGVKAPYNPATSGTKVSMQSTFRNQMFPANTTGISYFLVGENLQAGSGNSKGTLFGSFRGVAHYIEGQHGIVLDGSNTLTFRNGVTSDVNDHQSKSLLGTGTNTIANREVLLVASVENKDATLHINSQTTSGEMSRLGTNAASGAVNLRLSADPSTDSDRNWIRLFAANRDNSYRAHNYSYGTVKEVIFYANSQSLNIPAIRANINNQYQLY